MSEMRPMLGAKATYLGDLKPIRTVTVSPFVTGTLSSIEWSFKRNTVSPYFVNVPDTLKEVAFIEKDTKQFPNTHVWAYADWAYDAATDTFQPSELSSSGAECGYACRTTVSAQNYIFTAYPKR
jgi:hypothetical protein